MSSVTSSSHSKVAKLGNEKDQEVTPTKILSIAIRKRRELLDEKEADLRREIQHKYMIQSLCQHLGDSRAKKRRQRRKAKKSKKEGHVEDREDKELNAFCAQYRHELSYESDSGLGSSYSQDDLEQLGIRSQDQVLQVTPQNLCSFSDTNNHSGVFEQAMSGVAAATGFDENYDPFRGYSAFWSPSPSSSNDSSEPSCSSSASWENSPSAFSYPTDFSALTPQVVENDGYSPPSTDLTPLKPMKRRWDCGPDGLDMKRVRVEPVQDRPHVAQARYWTAVGCC